MSDVPEGYKMSEVGAIPEEWEVKKLGDAAEVVMGQSPVGTSYNRSGTGAPLINGPTEFTEKYPIKIQWTSQPTKFCKKGDVLLCVRGSSTGRINISDDEYCIGRGVAAIRAKSCADTSFITFQVDSAVKSILALTTGSTFPNIDGKSIRAIQFPFPPLPEQQAIASALSDVDALITALEQLITKKRNIKQGAMQQLLTGEKRLPGFGGVWEVMKLENVCAKNGLVRGPFGGTLKKEFFVRNGLKVYEQKNAIYRNVNLGNYFIDKNKFNELKRFEVKKGDFIVSCSGTIGKIYQIPRGAECGIINQALLKIKTDDNIIHDRFFFYYFDWEKFQEKIIDNTQGGAMQNLVGMNIFRNTQIPLPPLPEQQAIAQILSDMDAEIKSLEQKQAKYKAIKQGMMQELLTGKTRLV